MLSELQQKLQFDGLAERRVECDFTGGTLSSDGGLVLLRQLDKRLQLSKRVADCFLDSRDQRYVVHDLRELVAQRLLALCAGYEDLNDHNRLRLDPLFALAVDKQDPTGMDRLSRDRGKPLAAASTLNRLELGNEAASAGVTRTRRPPVCGSRGAVLRGMVSGIAGPTLRVKIAAC